MRQCLADRMEHAKRFRALLAHLGLSHLDAAKLLRVSLRTLQNWLSGTHQVPYSAFKLLRVMRYMELPGKDWAGWHFSAGVLVTPEGRTISGTEGSWWSLLTRQARMSTKLYDERNSLLNELRAAQVAQTERAKLAPARRASDSAQDPGLEGAGVVTLHKRLTDEPGEALVTPHQTVKFDRSGPGFHADELVTRHELANSCQVGPRITYVLVPKAIYLDDAGRPVIGGVQ